MPGDSLILTVTVFGSGRTLPGDPDYEQARLLGRELAARGFRVCCGGYGGVMEAAARGAKEAGGRTLGVTARVFRSAANPWIDEERAVDTWHERLLELVRLGHGYVACRGGTGTLAELAVVWEMLNKGLMTGKPLIALGEFWSPVLLRVGEAEAGRAPGTRDLVQTAAHPAEAAERLALALASARAGPPAGQL